MCISALNIDKKYAASEVKWTKKTAHVLVSLLEKKDIQVDLFQMLGCADVPDVVLCSRRHC